MTSPTGSGAQRRAGVLLHPTSLPGGTAGGTLGADAFHFVDFLRNAGFSVWQTLPLGPTHEDRSPYQCLSAHAGNPDLLDPERLADAEWLHAAPAARADFWPAAFADFQRDADDATHQDFRAFAAEQAYWLDDFALFMAIREEHGGPWWQWPAPLRDRAPQALADAHQRCAEAVDYHRFLQWQFFRQWAAVKAYANECGIVLFGDMPIFVAHDSSEVWAHRELFALDEEGQPETVAGVPPDYFSETGQYWGNPHYRWDRIAADGYRWWIDRLRTQLTLFDWVRIDHFRGFEAFWEIPAGEYATEGRWVPGPGADFFHAVEAELGQLPLVAEDLGVITPEVNALRDQFDLPGMKILQFGFDSDADNPYLPHNHRRRAVVYTGTHDNNTTVGWWQEDCPDWVRERVRDYLGHPGEPMPWPLIRAALASVAQIAVVPMQDLLALGADSRMNEPATVEGNWRWRFRWVDIPDGLGDRLRHWNALYGRA
ncbi:MAG TPA: 4-alpha-glucanotransferase [Gammaproteobacteria bacterium]|nr:4-alpha-glucanotransferase [Gammaproteobacteria bacterium]